MSGTILLTGATGVIGVALRPRLPAGRLVCLVRARGVENGARTVRGDVTRPRLGLDPASYAALAAEVDVVVNSAALTRFDAPRDEVFEVNVEGARNVARFARDAGARLVHLSTAFVGVDLAESSMPVSAKPYIDSKRAGEEVVRAAGVDLHIARPSLVIGDAATGYAARLQGYHFFVRTILRDNMPVIPVVEGEAVDFVSADLVADIVAAMALERPPGEESWLTAGPEAWEVTRFVEAVIAFAHEQGHEVEMPRLVAPDMVDRLLRPVFFKELPKRLVRRFDQLTEVSGAVVSESRFETTIPELRGHYGRPFELELERTFRASTGYLLGTIGATGATGAVA